jgi:hypothetical protein
VPLPNGTKVTLIFSQGKSGWTESWYLGSNTGQFVSEQASVNLIVPFRMALAGNQTSLDFVRLEDARTTRAVFVMKIGQVGTAGSDSDFVDTRVLVRRVDSTRAKSSRYFMGGIPDICVVQGGVFSPPTFWNAAFNKFTTQLRIEGWGWVGTNPLVQKKGPITSLVAAAGNQVIIGAAGTPFAGVVVGSRVRFSVSGIKGAASVNGTWTGVVQDASHVQTIDQIPFFPWVNNTGTLIYNTLAIIAIDTQSFLRTVERKAGRPLFQSRGRSRIRRLA